MIKHLYLQLSWRLVSCLSNYPCLSTYSIPKNWYRPSHFYFWALNSSLLFSPPLSVILSLLFPFYPSSRDSYPSFFPVLTSTSLYQPLLNKIYIRIHPEYKTCRRSITKVENRRSPFFSIKNTHQTTIRPPCLQPYSY